MSRKPRSKFFRDRIAAHCRVRLWQVDPNAPEGIRPYATGTVMAFRQSQADRGGRHWVWGTVAPCTEGASAAVRVDGLDLPVMWPRPLIERIPQDAEKEPASATLRPPGLP